MHQAVTMALFTRSQETLLETSLTNLWLKLIANLPQIAKLTLKPPLKMPLKLRIQLQKIMNLNLLKLQSNFYRPSTAPTPKN